jgi:hypothetical protein
MTRTLRCRLGRHHYVRVQFDVGVPPDTECSRCGKCKRTKHFDLDVHHTSSAGGRPAVTSRHNHGLADAYDHDRR